MTQDEVDEMNAGIERGDYFLSDDEDECQHDWQPVWSVNFAGRAYQCENCWDRTD